MTFHIESAFRDICSLMIEIPYLWKKYFLFSSFFLTYLKAQLSCIFAKCPGQSTLVLSVNTRRFYITYFMLRCKTVSPRGLRSLRKNDIFVMSLCLSVIQSLFRTRRDMRFWTLPPESCDEEFSIKDLLDVVKVKHA